MSWLSDIKQEAELQRQRDAAGSASAIEHLETVQLQLRVFKIFLNDLAEQFRVLNREIVHTYDVLGYARLTELRQGGYHIETDGKGPLIRKLTLRYECVGSTAKQFWVENRDECNTVKEQLHSHSLVFRFKDDANWRYIFTLQPLIKVEFTFEPDPTEAGIRLTAKNFERLGVTSYSFAADNVNDVLLDEFGKKLVKQENNFEEMSGYRVAQDVRKQFQEKIVARQKERLAELETTDGAKAAGRFGRLFKKGATVKNTGADPSVTAPKPAGASISKSKTADTSPAAAKKYAWMVTGSPSIGQDTSEWVSRLGPGMEYHVGIKNLVSKGTHFRMLDATGAVQYRAISLASVPGVGYSKSMVRNVVANR